MSSVWVNLIRALANRLTGIWVGIVALAGVLALGESASPARLLGLALILSGVVRLKLVEA